MLLSILLCLASGFPAIGQSPCFFRISGPSPTTITAFRTDGTIEWSNTLAGTNYTVQTVAMLPGISNNPYPPYAPLSTGTNWVSYIQLAVTNFLNTNQIVAFKPPAGMAYIPAGTFTMGDTLDGAGDALPVTNVFVSAVYMDVNLVTFALWQTVYNWATNHGYSFDNTGAGKGTNHPVNFIDWYDAVKWCNARSQVEGLTPVYYLNSRFNEVYSNLDVVNIYLNWNASGYRLPTEAEWEKAARGGLSGQRFPWGNVIKEIYANYDSAPNLTTYDFGPSGYNASFAKGAMPYTSPAGSFVPNGYGLYDMAGNCYQWCWDWYGTPYAGGSNPQGPATGSARVNRGGCWYFGAYDCRSACRNNFPPNTTFNFLGFRCVRAASQ